MSKARDLAGLFNLNPTSGTTAQRPATADVGDIYYNGTTGKTEIYTTTGWKEMASGIPFGNTAGRPTAVTGQPYFNGETARLELFTGTSWENIVQEVPGVASITGNYSEATNSGNITIAGTNFVSGAIASAIGTNGVEVIASSTTYNSLVQLTAVFTNLSNANEPYDIKVTNPSNLFGLIPDALYINASPVWQTTSGSLGTFKELVTTSVSATATDSDSTITYALASGSSLPSGIALNSSTGVISGNLPNISTNTTYNFTINASDGLNTIPRSFSFISEPTPVISGGILTSDSTYYYRTFRTDATLSISEATASIEYLMIAGGGAGNDNGGGGGAGGLYISPVTTLATGSYPIVIGAGASSAGASGGNTTFNSKTALGGGGAANGVAIGSSGGSGGGTGRDSNVSGGSATQPSSSTGGFGNAGGGGQATTYAGGGGGGGAGAAGGIGSPTGPAGSAGNPGDYYAGSGGIGLTNAFLNQVGAATSTGVLSNGNYYYAGGGGGGAFQMVPSNLSSYGLGGIGGGGQGGNAYDNRGGYAGVANYRPATSGTGNTGGGGGGAFYGSYGNSPVGQGGSGLVVIRYTKASVGG